MNRKPLLLEKWDFIVLLGESGGGKGTLVQNIKRYWLPELWSASMGEIFRKKAVDDPEIKELTEKGVLVSNEKTCAIFREFAIKNTPGLIDGFPRNRGQAIDLIRFAKDNNWRILVVDINCRIEKIIERLLARKRADDNLNIVYQRHTAHKELHPAVMEEIRTRPDLFDIIDLDGNHNSEIVFTAFLLSVLRLVDMLYFYDMTDIKTTFAVHDDETTINPAINRWVCGFLKSIQKKLNEK
ncbi:MAG: nucleoside monophosphate kinase [Clostridiales bacterium]|jgi:adenylate kinase family enzyme|nr:nucleoside monophosphate kinase [Clostridiales bacterium]